MSITAQHIGLTPDQLTLRRSGIGASEAPIISGLSPWGSRLDIWLAKTSDEQEAWSSDATEAGNRFEEPIARWYSDRTGDDLYTCGTERHPEDAWRLATVDRRRATDGGIVEIKTVFGTADAWGPDEDDPLSVPDYVRAQVLWQMDVVGARQAEVAAFIAPARDKKFRIYRVPWDQEVADLLREVCAEFWFGNVVEKVQPPVDGSERAREYLRRRFPRSTGNLLEATDEAHELWRRYHEAKAAAEPFTAEMELCQNQLMALVGEADGLDGIATWKSDKSGRPNWKAIAEALGATPDLIKQHTSEPGRRWLWKK